MRQLKPEVAQHRKKNLLQWVIHYYIKTSKPVSSAVVAQEAGLSLSSATIRSILQELEEEGYLHQPHTSSGREPTDKGYRFYVDYLVDVQRLASNEKEKIDRQYRNRIEAMDTLLSETSKLLSKVSHSAGLVLSPQIKTHALKRLELIHLGGRSVLGILVTEAGFVRHWPIRLSFSPSSRQINVLNRFLNDNIRGCSVSQAQSVVMAKLKNMEQEFQELNLLAGELLKEVSLVIGPDALYVEGADNILSHVQEIGDMSAVQSLMRMMEEKNIIAGLLESELDPRKGKNLPAGKPHVRIGRESGLPELMGLSLVTTTYSHQGRSIGVLGILGSKRMEYSRMMSLVEYLSGLVSLKLRTWDLEDEDDL
ncbi:MAG: heat-inducible transcription repressor HrcA [Elusimicrobia bacterium RIFCSPHIGHO2_02_FULL_57_9]|nr:MAG: heat-inducible transcription repressor HrcA [Elusimicrobia bacterium RIFCSPHIGHO2_02_FULL_57_9]